ncbi:MULTISPECIES: hypothetical protein [Kitasatospora]|uniref:Uncharacterized protein n=2 Tax=Kitasatospora TaxID=2063 RepID=A0ABT1J7B5_9ACTN|nr:hypothetical protein [Kitasatospora paracochleata]MCP2313326.1 hypothetical protein [Kitasatospora paracochleata]
MSMDIAELNAETVELLPSREALGRLKFVKIHVNVANVWAHNESAAANYDSPWAVAESEAGQSISIHQR